MKKRRVNLSEQLRRAVDNSGLSRYRICKLTGIDQGMFSHFMSGKVRLGLDNVDALADLLELDVVSRRKNLQKGV